MQESPQPTAGEGLRPPFNGKTRPRCRLREVLGRLFSLGDDYIYDQESMPGARLASNADTQVSCRLRCPEVSLTGPTIIKTVALAHVETQ